MVDDIGQIDIRFSTLVAEDSVVGISVVGDIVIDLPVREIVIHPIRMLCLDAGDDDGLADPTVGSFICEFRGLPFLRKELAECGEVALVV